jgi:23S rRNA (uracil1939-C5)-methyltransferase
LTTKDTPARLSPPEPGTDLELDFTDLLSNGQAVGRAGGLVVFCFGPLPGERARVRIETVKAKYAVAAMLELTRRSAQREQPFCVVFGTCGGCQVQHLSYGAQLEWKRGVVKNTLQRVGEFAGTEVRDPIGMENPRAYRNKMSLVVQARVLGFYKQRSHDLVPIASCPIVMPHLDAVIGALNGMAARAEHGAVLQETRHIVARTAQTTGQTVVTFTTPEASPALASSAQEVLALLPAAGVANSYDLSSQNAIVGRHHALLAGSAQIEEQIAGVRYRVSAASFFQVNVEIVGKIFEFLRVRLEKPRKIVDLYCGAGTFSLFFASLGCCVTGAEENAQAVLEAQENASFNRLAGTARFICGRVEVLVRRGRVKEALEQAQVAFLDPPRKGSDEATLGAIAGAGVAEIWYLSCDPATLARDLKFLSAKGYRLDEVQPFDMFPHTGHVETLAILSRTS